jgi:hypothetical protein
VTTGASIVFGGDSGALNVGGNTTSGRRHAAHITAGGTVSGTGPNGLEIVSIGRNGATGTVNISGPGSRCSCRRRRPNTQGLTVSAGSFWWGENGVSGTLNVTNGARFDL